MAESVSAEQPETNPPANYFEALGRLFYYFADARFAIAYLGSHEQTNFLSEQGAADFEHTAADFNSLAVRRTEWKELAGRFSELTLQFTYLLACTPASEKGLNYLGSSDSSKVRRWTPELMDAFSTNAQEISRTAWDLWRNPA